MGMFGMFGNKKAGGVETDDYGSDMVGMMKMLAGMPHMMRKPMMKGRINQLLALGEEQRRESIRDMIGAFHSTEINDKSREKLIATRVEIVAGLPEDKRRTVIGSRIEALKVVPQLEEADRRIQERVLEQLSTPDRMAFDRTWKQLTKIDGS